jgi:hypothetical protein
MMACRVGLMLLLGGAAALAAPFAKQPRHSDARYQ